MDRLSEARKELESQWGPALATKATDAFALFHTSPRPQSGQAETPAVVELLETPADPLWAGGSAGAGGAAHEAVEQLLAEEGPRAGALGAWILRRRAIERAREAWFLRVGPLLADWDAAAGAPGRIQACWLNATVKTPAVLETLAPVCEDDLVLRLDLPARIRPEISETRRIVGASGFARAHGVGGRGVVVGVIDGEVEIRHPAFADRLVHRGNYSKETWGRPHVHGTAVAGIIGANGASSARRDLQQVPLFGMAPAVTLHNYKVLALEKKDNGDDFDCALALQQAVEDGVHIANLSIGADGLPTGTSRLTRACNAAWQLGIVVVTSAGNVRLFGGITIPGDADGAIVVGATNRSGCAVARYSSRGPTASGVLRPHLVAPGGTFGNQMISCVDTAFGEVGFGTSFAAAHVSGLAALMLEARPRAMPDGIRARLIGEAKRLEHEVEEASGAGLVQVG